MFATWSRNSEGVSEYFLDFFAIFGLIFGMILLLSLAKKHDVYLFFIDIHPF